MKKKYLFVLLTAIASLIFFFASSRFYAFVAYSYIVLLLGSKGIDILSSTPLIITCLLLLTTLFTSNFWQLLHLRFHKKFVTIQFVAYCVILFIVIMFKSRGVQGINLNPLNIIEQLNDSAFIVFANTILFIPIGFFLYTRNKSLKQVTLLSSVVIITLEIIQFVCHLGIVDVVDVFTNLLGITTGHLIVDALVASGWTMSTKEDYHIFKKMS